MKWESALMTFLFLFFQILLLFLREIKHQHMGGGVKGACAPIGFEAKTVKSQISLFLANFYLISSFSTPVAWNPACANVKWGLMTIF